MLVTHQRLKSEKESLHFMKSLIDPAKELSNGNKIENYSHQHHHTRTIPMTLALNPACHCRQVWILCSAVQKHTLACYSQPSSICVLDNNIVFLILKSEKKDIPDSHYKMIVAL